MPFVETDEQDGVRVVTLARPPVNAIDLELVHALGGGLVLGLACDFRIAAEGAYSLGLTEVTAGIPFPAGPMAVVAFELDRAAARRLVLSGSVHEPASPAAAAFVDEVRPPSGLGKWRWNAPPRSPARPLMPRSSVSSGRRRSHGSRRSSPRTTTRCSARGSKGTRSPRGPCAPQGASTLW